MKKTIMGGYVTKGDRETLTIETVFPNQCALCSQWLEGRDDFRDECSWNEYSISGLCQNCQESNTKQIDGGSYDKTR